MTTKHLSRMFTSLLLLLFIMMPGTTIKGKDTAREKASTKGGALLLRIGVVSYDSPQTIYQKYEEKLLRLAKAKSNKLGRDVSFKLAVGSYSEVLNWYLRGSVDVAILTPALVAELRKIYGDEELKQLYVASHAADPQPAAPAKPVFEYHSMCAVNEASPIMDFDDLREWARQGRVNFHFTDPLSVSGRILPEVILREQNINNISFAPTDVSGQNRVTWMYNSTETKKVLSNAGEGGLRLDNNSSERANVGCFYVQKGLEKLRKIKNFPGLDEIKIPQEVVLVSKSFKAKDDLERLFEVNNPSSKFQKIDDWLEKFDQISRWVSKLDVSSRDPKNQQVTLQRIASVLRSYQQSTKKVPRVALVLSGGGAKCAYQLGAIEAIEDEISSIEAIKDEVSSTAKSSGKKIDIDLVVGTSGGSINALLVALGKTRGGESATDANRIALREIWESFDQREFFHPWKKVNFALGLSVGFLQTFILLGLSAAIIFFVERRRAKSAGIRQKEKADQESGVDWLYLVPGCLLLLLAVSDFTTYFFSIDPPWQRFGTLGMKHSLRHTWFFLTINLLVSGLTLLVLGALLMTLGLRRKISSSGLLRGSLLSGGAALSGVIIILFVSLFYESTLSRPTGVETALVNRLGRLVAPPAENSSKGSEEKLRAYSKSLGLLLQRDLIITGSRLNLGLGSEGIKSHESIPDDLYFYFDYKPCSKEEDQRNDDKCTPLPHYDARFQEVGNHLLDVIIGSSSIYPVFPSRTLRNFREKTPEVQIIDGGFAHNSPIDAAVAWGATHIILVEASPLSPLQESGLWDNASIAFNHLYYQAQLLDSRARNKIQIFTLRPTASKVADEPDLCTFDFSRDMIRIAIRRGYDDATNVSQPRFEREWGEPYLKDLGVETNE
jgi:predicted acylesterase/phospholipase RssA/ABC-type phosphate/phosphonate transport system substrate-binding protein